MSDSTDLFTSRAAQGEIRKFGGTGETMSDYDNRIYSDGNGHFLYGTDAVKHGLKTLHDQWQTKTSGNDPTVAGDALDYIAALEQQVREQMQELNDCEKSIEGWKLDALQQDDEIATLEQQVAKLMQELADWHDVSHLALETLQRELDAANALLSTDVNIYNEQQRQIETLTQAKDAAEANAKIAVDEVRRLNEISKLSSSGDTTYAFKSLFYIQEHVAETGVCSGLHHAVCITVEKLEQSEAALTAARQREQGLREVIKDMEAQADILVTNGRYASENESRSEMLYRWRNRLERALAAPAQGTEEAKRG